MMTMIRKDSRGCVMHPPVTPRFIRRTFESMSDGDAMTDAQLLQLVEDDAYHQMLERRIHRHHAGTSSLASRWRTRLRRWYTDWTQARTGWLWPVLALACATGVFLWCAWQFGLIGR